MKGEVVWMSGSPKAANSDTEGQAIDPFRTGAFRQGTAIVMINITASGD